MSTLEKAIAIAAQGHEGQVDKGGAPYILHSLRVMLAVEGEHAKMAAVLHDAIEDGVCDMGDLIRLGFPREVIDAVMALTRPPGMSRLDAARMAATNPIARVVKIADLKDNMDLSRIINPTARDHARLREYEEAMAVLKAAMP